MRRLAASIALVMIVAVGRADAADLYSFFDAACRRTTGVLVNVGPQTMVLVDLGGRLVEIRRDTVHSLVIHQPLENPLATIHVDSRLAGYVRGVWVGDDKAPSFFGWATAFYDDLFIFFDLEGKTHVLDPGDIQRLDADVARESTIKPGVSAAPNLAFPTEIVPCSKTKPPPEALPPSRVIADRIKLGDYLANLEERYLALEGFEERTRVYARPFLFDEASRLGLIYYQDMPLPIPFYFRFSSGRPYRFQSLSVIGNSPHEWLPTTEPTLSVRSDVKSHFFNAQFVGQLIALPAGTNAFLLDELDGPEVATRERVDVSYNYLIMMGGDYWRFSASAGTAYLATKVSARGLEPRPILAESVSPAVRLGYLAPDFSLRALYFRIRRDASLAEISGFSDDEMGTFDLESDIVRLGATVDIIEGVRVDADEIVTLGNYQESMTTSPIEMSFFHSETAVVVSAAFGRYVTVLGYARLLFRRYAADLPVEDETTRLEPRFGGALEFVF